MTITHEQFLIYTEIRDGGHCNMWNTKRVQEIAEYNGFPMTVDDIRRIMKNYHKFKEQFDNEPMDNIY